MSQPQVTEQVQKEVVEQVVEQVTMDEHNYHSEGEHEAQEKVSPEQYSVRVTEKYQLDKTSNGMYDWFGTGPINIIEQKEKQKGFFGGKVQNYKLQYPKKSSEEDQAGLYISNIMERNGCMDKCQGRRNFAFVQDKVPDHYHLTVDASKKNVTPFILSKPKPPMCGKKDDRYYLWDVRDPADSAQGKQQIQMISKKKGMCQPGVQVSVHNQSGTSEWNIKRGELMFNQNQRFKWCGSGGMLDPQKMGCGMQQQLFCPGTDPFDVKGQGDFPQGGELHKLPMQGLREQCYGTQTFQVRFPHDKEESRFINNNQKQAMVATQVWIDFQQYE